MFSPKDPNTTSLNFASSEADGSPHSPQAPQEPWNSLDSIFVTLPPWHPATIASSLSNGKSDKDKDRVPKNPVSHWRVSKKKVVGSYSGYASTEPLLIDSAYKDFVFSPDVKYVAAISEDGCLRVIDAVAEQ